MNYKILLISIFIIIICIINSRCAFSQYLRSDQPPFSIKWRTLRAPYFTLFYPTELEPEAQRMANTFTAIYPKISGTNSNREIRTPVILQNRESRANGFVQLAPKKIEFFTTPPQHFDSQDWLNNLAVHELRHLVQFNKIIGPHAGFPFSEIKFAYLGLSMPLWFLEGDAVTVETTLTSAGRGRQPSFIAPMRTALLNGRLPSYSEAYFGSDRNPTIGHYQLGYLLNTFIKANYNADIADTLLQDIRRRPLRLYPFSSSLKKLSGKGTRQWYLTLRDSLQKIWQSQDTRTKPEHYVSISSKTKTETNYYLPVRIDSAHILSIRQGKGVAPAFVLTDSTGKDQRLLGIGYQEQAWYSYGAGNIVWDEIREDPRYKRRSYSVLCIYNLQQKTLRQLSFKSRFFSPTLSPDGKTIAAISIGLNNKPTLIELDLATGRILNTLEAPKDASALQNPTYDRSGNRMAYIALSEPGKSLIEVDLKTRESIILFGPSRQQLARPVYFGMDIAFNAHFNGIDNIYLLDRKTKEITALTNARFGAQDASLTRDSNIVFSHLTNSGWEIATSKLARQPMGENNFIDFSTAGVSQENTQDIFKEIPTQTFQSSGLSPFFGLLNFHSISPDLSEDNDPGVKLKSENLLSTMEMFGSVHYQQGIKKLQYSAGISFKALYPIISVDYTNKYRNGYYYAPNGLNHVAWREERYKLQANIPLSFSSYNHLLAFNIRAATSLTFTTTSPLVKAIRFPMEYQISFSHAVRASTRDVAPLWGQYLSITHAKMPDQSNLTGNALAFISNFYFPGLMRHHSFTAGFNYQQVKGVYLANREIPVVFGYNQIKATSPLVNTLLLNYRFPLAFPDAELGPLTYIRNIRAGIFAHYENFGKETTITAPKTFGFELRSNMHLLRYLPIADIGMRYILVNKKYHQKPVAELIFIYNL